MAGEILHRISGDTIRSSRSFWRSSLCIRSWRTSSDVVAGFSGPTHRMITALMIFYVCQSDRKPNETLDGTAAQCVSGALGRLGRALVGKLNCQAARRVWAFSSSLSSSRRVAGHWLRSSGASIASTPAQFGGWPSVRWFLSVLPLAFCALSISSTTSVQISASAAFRFRLSFFTWRRVSGSTFQCRSFKLGQQRSQTLSPLRHSPHCHFGCYRGDSTEMRAHTMWPSLVAGRVALPAPTPPDMRVRIRRFWLDGGRIELRIWRCSGAVK